MTNKPKLTINYKKHFNANPLQKFLLENFYKSLTELTEDLQIESVLDAGCAEGFALNILKDNKAVKKLAGLDQSIDSINLGKKLHPFIKFTKGSIYKMPYKDKEFDMVICLEVLEHLTQPKKALKEIIRISKMYCLISVPNEPWFRLANFIRGKNLKRWGNDIEHIQHWSKKEFIQLLTKACLKPIKTKTPFPWTMMLAEKQLG
jgi:ubiquinone/menaquinone biosynthesis C-methylase UbiE